MSRFRYTVQDVKGETSTGAIDANDENEAITALQAKGLFILSLVADRSSAKTGTAYKNRFIGGSKVGERDLIFFGEQLATLLNGGVPLVRALSLLGEHSSSRGLQVSVLQVTKDVAGGMALYKALERHPRVFNTLWVSLVQAGEMGGQLPKVLKQIASYMQAQADLKAKVITALAYPAVLALMSLGVLVFFIVKIVPVFAEIFSSFQVQLPPLTAMIIGLSMLVTNHLFALICAGIIIWFGWSAYTATEAGKITKWNIVFSVPFFGAFAKNILIERLLTTLATLIESGVSILNAIAVLEKVFSSNIIFERFLRAVRNDVSGGKSISGAFRRSDILPPLVTEMIFMGEESGKLPEMLSTLSNFYREQIEQFTRRFTAIIDPILVVGIGGIVGVIVLAVFMPIFKLSTLGGARP
ncbi:MAG: type II secretion system F family protein [Elusimicrobia bacterium]|nr:type II secretion system F family protein [Elusimicrobiota bacterium]